MIPRARLASLATRVALWTAAGYLVVAGGLWQFQDALLLHPSATPRSAAALTLQGQYVGDLFEPAGAARATVVFFHGNGGSTLDRAFIGRDLAHQGYRAVLVEYPGYGSRGGTACVSEYGQRGMADFDLVRMQFPGKLIVVGESFGAGVASVVAGARAPAVCGVTLITPWNRLSDLVQEKLPIFPANLMLNADYQSDRALQSYRGPLTIVGAERDRVIPMHHARTLARHLPGSRFEMLDGADHNGWYAKVGASAWLRWLPSSCAR